MKTKYIIMNIIAGALLFCSCDKEEGETTPPAPVANIEASSDFGAVMLSWDNPSDEDLFYVDINFTDGNGVKRSVKSSKYASEKTIDGFGDTSEYEFSLRAFDENGNASAPASIKASADTPPFEFVINTVDVQPDFGGIKVSWTNDTGKEVKVVVSYLDDEDKLQTATFNATNTGSNILNGLSPREHTFTVIATDIYDHASEPVTFTTTPLVEEQVDRSIWTVVDFSSEEPAEANWSSYDYQGKVIAMFDGITSTFWHSAWSASLPPYPHWFIVDLGQTVAVSKFECFKREGKTEGHTKVKFYGSMDGENWTDFGEYDFDSSSDDAQHFSIAGSPQMRYFKFEAIEGPATHTHMSEISVYGGVVK
ncbi:DUF4959 domain-containing protein [Carboxylicivirga marina]|uniref:DUF4959 domain-containing protein n=1 Tax=Carboxylicivirga marina TaxID=2800988 RepID=A0ABS1HET4_9BACT|nr:DUF4959 domain-containing protein [Carboxylicivirga marina]MBK3516182.1 DUF4959 domain-containing protein [Carboxylicivirga marina]